MNHFKVKKLNDTKSSLILQKIFFYVKMFSSYAVESLLKMKNNFSINDMGYKIFYNSIRMYSNMKYCNSWGKKSRKHRSIIADIDLFMGSGANRFFFFRYLYFSAKRQKMFVGWWVHVTIWKPTISLKKNLINLSLTPNSLSHFSKI